MRSKKEVEDQLFEIGLVFLVIVIVGFVLYKLFLESKISARPCLFLLLFGIYCPGCGGTRAVMALFQGHFLSALWYHPLVPYTAVLYSGFMGTHALHRLGVKRFRGWKFHNWYLYVAIGIVILNFVGKNMLKLMFGIEM